MPDDNIVIEHGRRITMSLCARIINTFSTTRKVARLKPSVTRYISDHGHSEDDALTTRIQKLEKELKVAKEEDPKYYFWGGVLASFSVMMIFDNV